MRKAMCPDAGVKKNPSSSRKRTRAQALCWVPKRCPCWWSAGRGFNYHGSQTKGWEERIKEMPLVLWPYFFSPAGLLFRKKCPVKLHTSYILRIIVYCLQSGPTGEIQQLPKTALYFLRLLSLSCTRDALWRGEEEKEIIRSICRH